MLRTGGSRRPSTVAVSESSSADLAPGCDVEDPEALWQRATRPCVYSCHILYIYGAV